MSIDNQPDADGKRKVTGTIKEFVALILMGFALLSSITTAAGAVGGYMVMNYRVGQTEIITAQMRVDIQSQLARNETRSVEVARMDAMLKHIETQNADIKLQLKDIQTQLRANR